MEVYILSTCSPRKVLRVRTTGCLLFHKNMHATAQGHLETLYQLFQLKLSDHFKLTRQDRRVVWVVAYQSSFYGCQQLVRNFRFLNASDK